jgi:hypothetical protein
MSAARVLDTGAIIDLLQDEGSLLLAEPRYFHDPSSLCLPGTLRENPHSNQSSLLEAGQLIRNLIKILTLVYPEL